MTEMSSPSCAEDLSRLAAEVAGGLHEGQGPAAVDEGQPQLAELGEVPADVIEGDRLSAAVVGQPEVFE